MDVDHCPKCGVHIGKHQTMCNSCNIDELMARVDAVMEPEEEEEKRGIRFTRRGIEW